MKLYVMYKFYPSLFIIFLLSVMNILSVSLHKYSSRISALKLYWKLISCYFYFCFFIFWCWGTEGPYVLVPVLVLTGTELHRSAYTTSRVKWLSSSSYVVLKASRVGVHESLGGNRGRTADSPFQRNIPYPCGVSYSATKAMRNREEECSDL